MGWKMRIEGIEGRTASRGTLRKEKRRVADKREKNKVSMKMKIYIYIYISLGNVGKLLTIVGKSTMKIHFVSFHR